MRKHHLLINMPKKEDLYPVPNTYTRIFASDLNIGINSSQEDRMQATYIKAIFETGPKQKYYVDFFKHLLWYEEIVQQINLKKYNMKNVRLEYLYMGKRYKLKVSGVSQSRPSLIIGDKLIVKHNISNKSWDFFVKNIEQDNVFIDTHRKQFSFYYSTNASFDIYFVLSRRSFIEQHIAVHNIMSDNCISRIFPQKCNITCQIDSILTYFNSHIGSNKEQCLAVKHIVAGTSGTSPFLLHGPPGTGKTVTIVEAILQLVKQSPNNRIMVCTSSNMASDHVANGLLKYDYLFKSNKILHRDYSKSKESEIPKNLWQYSNNRTSKSALTSYNIVIITLGHVAGFYKKLTEERKGDLGRYITHLFIDEAAQASEPECLIPIYKLLNASGKVVLAGDPFQLGPVIMSKHAKSFGLGLSLMERLQKTCTLYLENDPKYTVMLKENFRSHPHILALPNKLFYHGQLRALAEKDPISDICILDQKKRCRSIVFHGVLSEELFDEKSYSYSNDLEFQVVRNYINNLLENHDVLPEDIGVITPYNKQVFTIQNWLKKCNLNDIEVGSVECFQGKEKRIIIISTVRGKSNVAAKDIKLGFLVDEKRFNVALTRGKAKVIVIGNPIFLQKDDNWRDYIVECQTLRSYYGFNESEKYNAKIPNVKYLTKLTTNLSLK